jgi:hypothetical protein
VTPERIVFCHVLGTRFRLTANFDDTDGGKKLTWRMFFKSVAAGGTVKAYAVEASEQNPDRLEGERIKLACSLGHRTPKRDF